jgi:hypothetical protein
LRIARRCFGVSATSWLKLTASGLAALWLAGWMAACARLPFDSGVAGQVLIGPMCPVVAAGAECPDRPFQAQLLIETPGGRQVAIIQSDDQGAFRQELAPGDYLLVPQPANSGAPPAASQRALEVVEGQWTEVKVIYDSGIR